MDWNKGQAARPYVETGLAGHAPIAAAARLTEEVDPRFIHVVAGTEDSGVGQVDSSVQPRIDDEWRRWIAENLLIGVPVELIIEAMERSGFTSDEGARELKAAEEHPYMKGSALLRHRLKKREWLLAAYRLNNRLHPDSGEIDRRHRLSRLELLCDYYSTNRPVIITRMIDDWPATGKWNLDYLVRTFGDRQVEVRMPRKADTENDEIGPAQNVGSMRFGEFVEQMRTADESEGFDLTAHHASVNRKALAALWDDIGQLPEYLATDRQGGFLWMAPRGTITPFQHSLTNNLMAQVLGRTRVKISPSWDMPFLFNNLHWFSQADSRLVPTQPRPPRDEPQIHEVILDPGEVLFLPIGWMYYVEAIEIAITATFANFVFDNDFASSYTTYGSI